MKKVTESSKMVLVQRERRYFSVAARQAIVQEIDKGLSKAEAGRRYEVSLSAIYKWLHKYSKKYEPCLVKVVEHASEGSKIKQLEAELEKTYGLLGRAKAELMYLEQIIERANEELGCDLKKNTATPHYSTSTAKKKEDK